jgi:UDP:flavonoid glycosyltransferase YjiC (YdhE family)
MIELAINAQFRNPREGAHLRLASTSDARPLSPRLRAGKPRVLFFAEAVSLAHVARPHVLAQALARNGYEVLMARDPRYSKLFGDAVYATVDIRSIPSATFFDALARGRPIYSADALRAYVTEDLAVMEEFRPDHVVGDFRLSLAVSAPIIGVPHMAVTNACWSPYAKTRFTVPDVPIVRMLGLRAADAVFRAVRPCAFALHARPLNRIRREFGLESLGLDLRRVYTHADHTLYADLPQLAPTFDLPANHHYLGPITWSPAMALPRWWNDLPRGVPVVYVNLGSTGPRHLLPEVLEALASMPVAVIAATAGQKIPNRVPGNVFVADYLPGERAATRARLVICNGGSPATQQALTCGVPVLGIASNLDQYANMHCVQQAGAGVLMRSGQATVSQIRSVAATMLEDWSIAAKAAEIRLLTKRFDASARIVELVAQSLAYPANKIQGAHH